MGNFVGGHPSVCELAYKEGFEEVLLKNLSSSDSEVRVSASYALKQYHFAVNNRLR